MAEKPLIGITGDVEERDGRVYIYVDHRYGKLVEESGGIPVLIHPTRSVKDIVSRINGLLLSGGEDIHPRYYGEEPGYPMTLSPDMRTEFELSLLRESAAAGTPILGICHGMQLINVAFGGTLYQDLPVQIEGAANHKLGDKRHGVLIEEGSLLLKAVGKREIDVTSTHHQAVREPGSSLRVCARSHDGIIEAIELPGHPFLIGVQWHPEKDPDENSSRLFNSFILSSSVGC